MDPIVLKRNIKRKLSVEVNLMAPGGIKPGQQAFATDTGNLIQAGIDVPDERWRVLGEAGTNNAIDTYVSSQKGSPNGIAPLDGDGKIPTSYILSTGTTASLNDVAELDAGDVVKSVNCLLYAGDTFTAFVLKYVVHSRGKLTTISIPRLLITCPPGTSFMYIVKDGMPNNFDPELLPATYNQPMFTLVNGADDATQKVGYFTRYSDENVLRLANVNGADFTTIQTQIIFGGDFTFIHA